MDDGTIASTTLCSQEDWMTRPQKLLLALPIIGTLVIVVILFREPPPPSSRKPETVTQAVDANHLFDSRQAVRQTPLPVCQPPQRLASRLSIARAGQRFLARESGGWVAS